MNVEHHIAFVVVNVCVGMCGGVIEEFCDGVEDFVCPLCLLRG